MKPFAIAACWKDQIPATTAHLLELHVKDRKLNAYGLVRETTTISTRGGG